MKKRNEAHQVRENDPALDIRKHKRPFLGPEATPAGKIAKKKSTRQGLPLRIFQLNVEGLTTSKLDIVERLATQHNVGVHDADVLLLHGKSHKVSTSAVSSTSSSLVKATKVRLKLARLVNHLEKEKNMEE